MLARSGICWSRLVFLPLRQTELRGGCWRTFFGDLLPPKRPGGRGCLGGGPGSPRGAVVVGRGERELGELQRSAGGRLSGGAGSSGPKGDLPEGEKH